MKDPIGAFDTIKENFIRYVKTAFKTRFDSIEEERYQLLHQDKVLYRQPWIEVLPEYKSSNKHIRDLESSDLPGLDDLQIKTFKGLVEGGLFPNDFTLFEHQTQMLLKALSGKNCIITSGTGSGKTESFLLCILCICKMAEGPACFKSALLIHALNPYSFGTVVYTVQSLCQKLRPLVFSSLLQVSDNRSDTFPQRLHSFPTGDISC